jgi:hypothetical protein
MDPKEEEEKHNRMQNIKVTLHKPDTPLELSTQGTCQNFGGNPSGKHPLGTPRRKSENRIKMNPTELQ